MSIYIYIYIMPIYIYIYTYAFQRTEDGYMDRGMEWLGCSAPDLRIGADHPTAW